MDEEDDIIFSIPFLSSAKMFTIFATELYFHLDF